jgi:hypothetical protein
MYKWGMENQRIQGQNRKAGRGREHDAEQLLPQVGAISRGQGPVQGQKRQHRQPSQANQPHSGTKLAASSPSGQTREQTPPHRRAGARWSTRAAPMPPPTREGGITLALRTAGPPFPGRSNRSSSASCSRSWNHASCRNGTVQGHPFRLRPLRAPPLPALPLPGPRWRWFSTILGVNTPNPYIAPLNRGS